MRLDKFRPSDFPGREHQLNQAGSISIGGLPKWCGCHRTSVMGLKITPSDPGGLWCGHVPSGESGFMCPQWNPSNYRCKHSRTPYQNYFSSLTQFTKAVIRAKENGRHPRHVEKKKGETGQKKWRNRRKKEEEWGQWQLIRRPQAIFLLLPPSFSLCPWIKGLVDINKGSDDDFPWELWTTA